MDPQTGVGVFAIFLSIIAIIVSAKANSIAGRESAAAEKAADEAAKANSIATRSSAAAEKAAKAAEKQTKIQEALRRGAAEPNLWADIRPDDREAQLILLAVGNSGPTVATNVVVTFDPPLKAPPGNEIKHAEERLKNGLASLPPGRTFKWFVGTAAVILNDPTLPLSYTVTIRADGPFGPLEPLTYPINLEDIRRSLTSAAPGTLYGVTQAVKTLGKSVEQIASNLGK